MNTKTTDNKRYGPATGFALATVLFATVLFLALTGCSGLSATNDNSENPPEGSQEQTEPELPKSHTVTIMEVIDAVTYNVEVSRVDDPMLGEEFEVSLTLVDAPAEGECGFEESHEAVEDYFENNPIHRFTYDPEEPIDSEGVHRGSMVSARNNLVRNGLLAPDADRAKNDNLVSLAKRAAENEAGMHAICPDFG